MAGGGVVAPSAGSRASQYSGGLNTYVILVALIGGAGGLLFGYDIGVTGGVTGMAEFQAMFFPDVYERAQNPQPNDDPYCTYSDSALSLFTSSFFLAGMVISVFAAYFCRRFGRKPVMFVASLLFLAGAGLNAGAQNVAMLVVGRILLGFGVGCANTLIPLYLSEVAPHKYRGALNMMFQLAVTIGIIASQLINYGTQNVHNGWRISLGLAGMPAIILLIGSIVLPETPNSLVERGQQAKGKAVLQRLRGCTDVEAEFQDIVQAAEEASRVSTLGSYRALFQRRYSPMTIVTASIAMLQQLTGINAIMFYVPVIFQTLGHGQSASLMNTCIVGAVNVVATFVGILAVDKFGRRGLFLEGGIQMCIGQIITGAVLAVEFNSYTPSDLPKSVAIGVLVVICVYVAAFAWSWGPLGWLVPSEVQTLETRAAGMSTAVFVNFLFSFVIGQAFLPMMCAMRWGVFLFFAAWIFLMTLGVAFFLPETKGVPVESVPALFATHKVWGKVMGEEGLQQFLHKEHSKVSGYAASQLEKQ